MTDTKTPLTRVDLTPTEAYEALTGWDEIAVAARFGVKVAEVKPSEDPATFLRILVFTAHRRAGWKDADAYDAAMSMTLGECKDFHKADDDDDEGAEGPGEGDAATTS